jgi:hypothetical protein
VGCLFDHDHLRYFVLDCRWLSRLSPTLPFFVNIFFDFITSKPTLSELVKRFRSWRDHLETLLDNRSKMFYLEHFAPYLVFLCC